MRWFSHSRRLALAVALMLLVAVTGCAGKAKPAQTAPVETPPAQTPPAPSQPALPKPNLSDVPQFSRIPAVADWSGMRKTLTAPPTAPATFTTTFAVDLRIGDPSGLDLRESGQVLMDWAIFDTATRWPDKMPAGYDPLQILNVGLNPGLGLRELHKSGVTGKGIHVAILDQTLLLEHQEYAGKIRIYREAGDWGNSEASMHGGAVTSILVGRNAGVAPDATVDYYAVQVDGGAGKPTFIYMAQAVNQILDRNELLPEAERVRVISTSISWNPDQAGYSEMTQAVERAKKAGVFVVSVSLEQTHGLKLLGTNRDPVSDPDDPASYSPGFLWANTYYGYDRVTKGLVKDTLMVPMDSRSTAAPIGKDAYAFFRLGGSSWTVPYVAGLYALALQVKPDVTPDQFWAIALKTSTAHEITVNGQTYTFGGIVNPAGIIKELRGQ